MCETGFWWMVFERGYFGGGRGMRRYCRTGCGECGVLISIWPGSGRDENDCDEPIPNDNVSEL